MTGAHTPSVADVLDAAADKLTPEGAWIKGDFARDANGDALENGYDKGAVCFCAVGAIEHVTGDSDLLMPARRALAGAIGGSVTAFNDAPGRTQAEVIAKLREAANAARATSKEASHG